MWFFNRFSNRFLIKRLQKTHPNDVPYVLL